MTDKRTDRLLDKVFACIEEGEWQKADEYCEAVLETDFENAQAYLGKLMAELEIRNRDELKIYNKPIEESENYKKIISIGDEETVELVKSANDYAVKVLDEKRKKKAVIKKAVAIGVPVLAVAIALVVVLFTVIIPAKEKDRQYKQALAFIQSGETYEAMCAFRALGDYKDSAELLRQLRIGLAPKDTICAGPDYIVAVETDGKTVMSGSSELKTFTDGWSDIVSVSSGLFHTVALKADGTVAATEINDKKKDYGQCNISTWADIIAVSAGDIHTVGLKADGTVVASGDNYDLRCNVSGWTDIIAVSAGRTHTVGLKADGTVIALGDNSFNQCNVSGWTDIIAISAGESHTVGLKSDGTVVVTDCSDRCFPSQSASADWTDIVAVSAGSEFTVGLKSDGTVVATGDNTLHQIDVGEWKDIVAISAGKAFVAGLKADGTVVSTGRYVYTDGISGWNGIKLPTGSTAK